MSELYERFLAAQEAVGAGVEADMDARTEIRSRVKKARGRRAAGTAIASVAAIGLASVATVAVAHGLSDPVGPAGPSSPTAAPSVSADAGDSTQDAGSVEVPVVGGGMLTFPASSRAAAESVLGEPGEPTRFFDPITADERDGYGDGWAVMWAFSYEDVEPVDDVPIIEDSRLVLARPDGSTTDVLDLVALTDAIGVGSVNRVDTLSADPTAPRVLVSLNGEEGIALVLLDLAEGTYQVLSGDTWFTVSAIQWTADGWRVWGDADGESFAVDIAADGSAWSTDGLWGAPTQPSSDDEGTFLYTAGGYTVWSTPAQTYVVNEDGSVTPVCDTNAHASDCYGIGLSDAGLLVVDGDEVQVLDVQTGARSILESVSAPLGIGEELTVLGDGYLELPDPYGSGATAIWHRVGEDVEVALPAPMWVFTGTPGGNAVWFAHNGGVIDSDGAFHELDLGSGRDEWFSVAFPVG